MMLSAGLFLISLLVLSCLSSTIFNERSNEALAQQYIQTIIYRNLVIDLGNGLKTNAQLTLPAIGKGPFPAVLLIPGSGAVDMNETSAEAKNTKPFWQTSQYLTERGFAVLRYDKRGVGEGGIIVGKNVWGNLTINDLIKDSKKALNVLLQQPQVDPDRVSILGHSEGTIIAPRVAIDNPTKVKNIVPMGTVAQNGLALEYNQLVGLPIEYANQVLDKNHTGLISIQQVATDPILSPILLPKPLLIANDTEAISSTLTKGFGTNHFISIDKQLKPVLMKGYENITSSNLLKCNQIECPIWFRSHSKLIPTLSVIGNVSNSTGILMLNGENDSQTPVQQSFLLQQRLTDVKHPDHSLITYPNLGHLFYPSSQWKTSNGPIPEYVLADLYAWLEAHSGFTNHAPAAHIPTTSSVKR